MPLNKETKPNQTKPNQTHIELKYMSTDEQQFNLHWYIPTEHAHGGYAQIHIENIHAPFSSVGWGCRLYLCRGVKLPPTRVLDGTLNNLIKVK